MNPRLWSYGDPQGDDVPVRDRPYESFGQQGLAMPDHASAAAPSRGVARLEMGEPALERDRKAGPRNWQRSDERIHDEICARLADDGWVDASDVEVVVHHGEVALSGTVPDRDQRERAVALADSVRGVVDVLSRLRVRSR